MNHIAKLGCTVLALGAISSSAHSHADTLLGLYAGGQMWAMETEGAFASNNDLATFNYDDERNGSYYLAVEHFVPLIPNVKVIQTSMDTNGATNLSGEFNFGGQDYAINTSLRTDLSLTTTDYILYYEILDNDVVSIDVGINEKNIDGEIWIAMEKSEFIDIDDNTFEALGLTIQFSDEGDGEHEVTETIKNELNFENLVFTE